MKKTWLIRTSRFKILGPISRGKIIELYEKGSFDKEDEICPANGFWFFIREKDLLQKYLLDEVKAPFNLGEVVLKKERRLVKENTAVIDLKEVDLAKVTREGHEDMTVYPKEDDLDYPMSPETLKQEKKISSHPFFPIEDDLKYPEPKKKKTKENNRLEEMSSQEVSSFFSLKILILTLIFFLFGIIYYYKKVLNQPLPFFGGFESLSLIKNSYAKKPVFYKKKIHQYNSLNLPFSEKSSISFEEKFSGAVFRYSIDQGSLLGPLFCKKTLSLPWKIYLSTLEASSKPFIEALKCFPLDKELFSYFNYKEKGEGLRISLKKMGVKESRIIEVLEIQKKVDHLRLSQRMAYKELIKTSLKQGKKRSEYFFFYKKYKMKFLKSEHPISLLLDIYYMLGFKNQGGAYEKLTSLLRMSPIEYSIYMGGMNKLKIFDKDIMGKKITSFLKKITKSLKDKNHAKLLLLFFKMIDPKMPGLEELINQNEANWSLIEMRKMARSFKYGPSFLSLWAQLIFQRSGEFEIEKLLSYWALQPELDIANPRSLWVFGSFKLENLKSMKRIGTKIRPMIDNPNEFWEYYLSTWLSHTVWRSQFKGLPKIYFRPLFFKKRKSLIRLLNENGASKFSIFQLMSMGDENPDYFWWYVL